MTKSNLIRRMKKHGLRREKKPQALNQIRWLGIFRTYYIFMTCGVIGVCAASNQLVMVISRLFITLDYYS